MGDGDRILRNSKFEMLCASVRGHTKYKLWLWRFQAYVTAILTQKRLKKISGTAQQVQMEVLKKNIPNDNMMELHVQLVKKKSSRNGGGTSHI